ncbi:glutamyl-tRNA synthetase [Sphaeroforma arctica JP610]|uniref:glutamate--tRNA ligase n=1 Tax=Sphaeroforma arctica JP610 TaxID=667725 RepID=A0A0L0GHB2_9EUKA|nr:glutamyl-tRNA synthetase [Sphaeroforma arctica JP610]KNC87723.1 glutamyl-tRNA synthetase [Sphaeroforma arctica JP610]|eukprot:XP_014161625.1 glutamyl-tRNA synthetase [Sphaeroforma arctica JP610]
MHLGGLRTALFNLFLAKRHGGKVIMRLEDTDRTRYNEQAEKQLETTLNWAGIEFDESPAKGGDFGPYVQSERLGIYTKYATRLMEAGHAYRCYCSADELEIQRKIQSESKGRAMYNRKCLHLPDKIKAELLESGAPHVIRMKVPEGHTVVSDAVYGDVHFENANIDDQVLVKVDGYPTYHLAVVVDDTLMKISHVLRGEEWLASTPKHLILYDMIGVPAPVFAHLPLLLKADRTKLSKRHNDAFVEYYKEKGYLPAALCHFVSMLGWAPQDSEMEIWSLDDLSHEFSFDGVNRSGSIVDEDKLNYINRQHMIRVCGESKLAPTSEMKALISCLRETVEKNVENKRLALCDNEEKLLNNQRLQAIINIFQDRAAVVSEIPESAAYLFAQPSYDSKPIQKWGKKVWKPEIAQTLRDKFEQLTKQEFAKDETLATIIEDVSAAHNTTGGAVMQLLRYTITGSKMGGSVAQTASVLGKDEVLRRFDQAITITGT